MSHCFCALKIQKCNFYVTTKIFFFHINFCVLEERVLWLLLTEISGKLGFAAGLTVDHEFWGGMWFQAYAQFSALTRWGMVRHPARVKAYTFQTKSALVFQESLGIAGEQVILESWNVTGNMANSITRRVLQTWAYQFWSVSFSACKHVYVQVYVHTGAYVYACVWRRRTALALVQQASSSLSGKSGLSLTLSTQVM